MKYINYKAVKVEYIIFSLIFFFKSFVYNAFKYKMLDITLMEITGIIFVIPVLFTNKYLCLSLILIFTCFLILSPISFAIFPEFRNIMGSYAENIFFGALGVIIAVSSFILLLNGAILHLNKKNSADNSADEHKLA